MANKKAIAGGSGALAVFVALCMAYTAPHEGIRYDAYRDSGGVWTICRGHTGGVKAGDRATPEQCEEYYRQDIEVAVGQLRGLTQTAIPPDTEKVFVDFVFNVGVGNFQKSTMLRKINAGDLTGACNEFPRWSRVAGKDCNNRLNNCFGIIIRRLEQQKQCLEGLK